LYNYFIEAYLRQQTQENSGRFIFRGSEAEGLEISEEF
jgi:hypothetical protein